MRTVDKNGVHIDQCQGCRGIFLDRGELEQIAGAENAFYAQATPPPYQPDGRPGPRGYADSPRPHRGGYPDSPGGYRGGHGSYNDSPRPYRGGDYRDSPRPYHGGHGGHGGHRKRSFFDGLFD